MTVSEDLIAEQQHFLRQLKETGFDGVQNFPTVGLIDGRFRQNLEETGMGFDLEIDMIRQASSMGMLTCPYVFDDQQAAEMARAGADLMVAHMGLTAKGSIGAETSIELNETVHRVQAIREAAVNVKSDVLTLCHGGPIAEPEDAAYVLERTEGIAGFIGASSMERIPTETAIREQVSRFKSIRP